MNILVKFTLVSFRGKLKGPVVLSPPTELDRTHRIKRLNTGSYTKEYVQSHFHNIDLQKRLYRRENKSFVR